MNFIKRGNLKNSKIFLNFWVSATLMIDHLALSRRLNVIRLLQEQVGVSPERCCKHNRILLNWKVKLISTTHKSLSVLAQSPAKWKLTNHRSIIQFMTLPSWNWRQAMISRQKKARIKQIRSRFYSNSSSLYYI